MKKLLLPLIILFGAGSLFAQPDKVRAQFEKKIAASDEDIQNEKKKTNSKTWISRAQLFQDAYDEPTKAIMTLMPQTQVNLLLKDEKPIGNETAAIGGVNYSVTVYPDKKLYFNQNGELSTWIISSPIGGFPLQKAYDAYMESIKYDSKKGVGNKKIIEGLTRLQNQYRLEGSNAYELMDYKKAAEDFKMSLACSGNPVVGKVDSIMVYYTGKVALLAKDYPTAQEYLEKAVKINYTEDGEAQIGLAEVYREQGKKAEALNTLESAMTKYPKNKRILLSLIDYYRNENEDPKKILPLLKKAQDDAGQSEKAILYAVEGELYQKLAEAAPEGPTAKDDISKAIVAYNKAIETSPGDYSSYWSIATLYFNRGVAYNDMAMKPNITDDEYRKALSSVMDEFELALPYLLKAYELKPDEKIFVQTLKDVYFRIRDKRPEYKAGYDKFQAILDSM